MSATKHISGLCILEIFSLPFDVPFKGKVSHQLMEPVSYRAYPANSGKLLQKTLLIL